MIATLRHPIHRGSVVAGGVYFDVTVLGEEESRRRALGLWEATSEVHRANNRLVLLFAEPRRLHTSESPGGLLVRQGKLLSSAPLEKDELAALDDGASSVLICAGSAATKCPLDAQTREDPAAWIDVSDWHVEERPSPLGHVRSAPAETIVPLQTDIRATLGVGEAAPGAEAVREALLAAMGGNDKLSRKALSGQGSSPSGGGGTAALTGVLGALVNALASILTALFPARRDVGSDGVDPGGFDRSRGGHRGSGGGRRSTKRTLPEASPFEALTRGLRMFAARLLAWSRLSRLVGRRQAEYVSRMLDMFERGDLDEALRHAIALGEESERDAGPALGAPSPRRDLAISPHRGALGTSLYSTPDLFEELRRRYRKAFEDLESRGEIDKAAFVLAELLHAHEEAVSFLERHGRLRLAAEIAEARDLPAGLVVRQWFLANEPARAVAIARARDAFREAIRRLEASGHNAEAEALAILCADHLASIGDYSAAVGTIWRIPRARPLAREWLDRAIAIGGAAAGRAAIQKMQLVPEAFPEVRDVVLGLLREPEEEDAIALARGMAPYLLDAARTGDAASTGTKPPTDTKPPTGTHVRPGDGAGARALGKSVVRTLLRSRDPEDKGLTQRLLKVVGDAALLADLQRTRGKDTRKGTIRGVTADGFTGQGRPRNVNEDTVLVTTLAKPPPRENKLHPKDDATRNGLFLVVVDGLGGMTGGDTAATLARDTLHDALQEGAPDLPEAEAIARLRKAVAHTNQRILAAQQTHPLLTGCGATFAAATIAGDSLLIAHMGDSRAYLFRQGELTALTQDHSLARAMLQEGKLKPEDVPDFPHQNIVTRALGTAPNLEPDLTKVPVCDGDALLLCTDGLWRELGDEEILRVLSRGGPPEALRARLVRSWWEKGARDDAAIVVAHFASDRPAMNGGVEITTIDATGVAASAWSPEGDDARGASSLDEVTAPIEIGIHPDDAGALPIFDAAELPDGRFLVALGEVGSSLISREGRTIARFNEPAHRIVISDHGDRALVLAPRGEAQRIARIDVAGKREQAWCDARIGPFAADFDGSSWYVVRRGKLAAIDVLDTAWSALWTHAEDGADVVAIARSSLGLACLVEHHRDRELDVITLAAGTHKRSPSQTVQRFGAQAPPGTTDLAISGLGAVAEMARDEDPSRGLRLHVGGMRFTVGAAIPPSSRGLLAIGDLWVVAASWPRPAESPVVHVVHLGTRAERLRIDLAGRGRRCGARIQGDRLVVFDDRGRLLVISLRTGKKLRDLRLS